MAELIIDYPFKLTAEQYTSEFEANSVILVLYGLITTGSYIYLFALLDRYNFTLLKQQYVLASLLRNFYIFIK